MQGNREKIFEIILQCISRKFWRRLTQQYKVYCEPRVKLGEASSIRQSSEETWDSTKCTLKVDEWRLTK